MDLKASRKVSGPSAPNMTPPDYFTSKRGGSSLADTLPYQLQRGKIRPSPQERIEEVTPEDGRLRQGRAILERKTHRHHCSIYESAKSAQGPARCTA